MFKRKQRDEPIPESSIVDRNWVEKNYNLPPRWQDKELVPADLLARVEELRPLAEAQALGDKVAERAIELRRINHAKQYERERQERIERDLREAPFETAKAQRRLAELEEAIQRAKEK